MTTKCMDDLFFLCRSHMYPGLEEQRKCSDEIELDALEEAIAKNNLTEFLYEPLKEIYERNNCHDEKTTSGFNAFVRHRVITEMGKYQAIRIVNAEAKKRGIDLIFFKGLILADLYPQFAERVSSDSDILVSDEQKDAAEKLLCDCGYEKVTASCKTHVQVYDNKAYAHVIELHTRLWEDYEGPKIDILKSLNLSSEESNIIVKACGIEVKTLGVEEHLLYQFFHIIKHFSLDGIGIRYLIDITLFVNRYYQDIDFDLFWKHVDILGYTKFVEAFFKICIDELNMTNKVFYGHEYTLRDSTENLKIDLLNVGNTADKEAGWQIMGAMEAYFTGDAAVPDSKIKRQISMIFPPVDALPKVYDYAIKYPVLLPVAWIHRGCKFLIKRQFHKEEFYGVREKIDVAERRMNLIEEMGLAVDIEKDEH